MNNILITGAFGFVGTNLSKAIKVKPIHQLIAVDIIKPANHIFDEFYSWNDLKKIDWKTIDVVIHLAGKAHDTKNSAKEKDYFDINVGLTQKIFEYFLKSKATKFIYFSSVKAIADSVKGEFLTEEDIPNPQTPYGKSKLEAEEYIKRRLEDWEKEGSFVKEETSLSGSAERFLSVSRRIGMTDQKKVYVLRSCMIHGPGNKGNLNLLYKLVQKGIPWPLGAFENKRSFTSIDNLAFIIHQLIEKNIEPGIYHVADDEPISTNRLIRLIAKSNNKRPHIWKVNKKLILGLAKFGDRLKFPLNSERLKKLTESYVVSNEKLKKALGIKKMPVTAEEGFRRTFESFREK